MNRLLAIVGATATGKSGLAIRLAERVGGEILNADSRLVYRRMDIGTAKPSPADRVRVPHHVIDVVDPDQPFSLATYLDLARSALASIWRRQRLPLLVGGTGQYVWALLEGWSVPRVAPAPALRAELEAQAATPEGRRALVAELAAVDPAAAQAVDVANPRRLVRALEVLRLTGQPPIARAKHSPEFDSLILGLWCERAELYRRINARVEAMMAAGFVEEVRSLIDAGYGCELPSMTSIGYRQICAYLRGELTLEDATTRIETETHRLARMQHNWFRRSDPRIRWLDVSAGDIFGEALALVQDWLAGA